MSLREPYSNCLPMPICLTNLCSTQTQTKTKIPNQTQPGDEADEEDDDDADVVDFVIAKRAWRPGKSNHHNHLSHNSNSAVAAATLTDFEADSESSDLEQVQQLRRGGGGVGACCSSSFGGNSINQRLAQLAVGHVNMSHAINSSNSINGNNSGNGSSSTPNLTNLSLLQTRHGNKMLPPQCHSSHNGKSKSIAVAVITPNTHHTNGHHNAHGHGHGHAHDLNKSPTVLRKSQMHRSHNDTSKFNRSNRKSKNCAIFYFKHLDTDNETSGAGTDPAGEDHEVERASEVSTVSSQGERSFMVLVSTLAQSSAKANSLRLSTYRQSTQKTPMPNALQFACDFACVKLFFFCFFLYIQKLTRNVYI